MNIKKILAMVLALAFFFGQIPLIDISFADSEPGEELIGQKVDAGYFDIWRHADGITWQDTDYDGIRDEPGQEKTVELYIIIPQEYYDNFKDIRFAVITNFGQTEYDTAGGYIDYANDGINLSFSQYEKQIIKYTPSNYYHISGKKVHLKLEGNYENITKTWQGRLVSGRRYYLPFIVKFYGKPKNPPPPPDNNGFPIAAFSLSTTKPLTNQEVYITNMSYHPNSPKESIVSYKWEVEGVGEFTTKDINPVSWSDPGNYDITLTVKDQDGDEVSLTQTINVLTAAPNEKPVASFTVSSNEITEGQGIEVINNSYHPNSPNESIVTYEWKIQRKDELTGWYFEYRNTRDIGSISWNLAGTYRITLTVVDQDGESDSESETISVDEAIPIAVINAPEEALVNREVKVDGNKSFHPGFGDIDLSKNRWQIYRPNGTLAWSGKQQYPKNEPPPNNFYNIAGDWRVRLQVEDEDGTKSEWTEKIIKVLPDNKPLVDFTLPDKAIRNVVNNYEIQAQSTSVPAKPDRYFGEEIFRHIWLLKYDSDNNGTYDITINPNTTNSYAYLSTTSVNDKSPKIKAYVTGNFRLELQTQERYYAWGMWRAGLYSDKVIKDFTVENLAPVGTFNTEPVRNAEITFVIDGVENQADRILSIQNNLANFQQQLLNNNIRATVNIREEGSADIYKQYGFDNMNSFYTEYEEIPPYDITKMYSTFQYLSCDMPLITKHGYLIQNGGRNRYIEARNLYDYTWSGNIKIPKQVWRFNTNGECNKPPALSPDGNTVYQADRDYYLYALDVNTGAKKWEQRAGSGISHLVVDTAGDIYVFSQRNVTKVDKDGNIVWKKYDYNDGALGKYGIVDESNVYGISYAYYAQSRMANFWVKDKNTGETKWRLLENCIAFAVDENYVYLDSYVNWGDPRTIKKMNKETGEIVKTFNIWGENIVVKDNYLYITNNSKAYKVDKNTGQIIWQATIGNREPRPPLITDNKMYVTSLYSPPIYGSAYDLCLDIIDINTGEKLLNRYYITGKYYDYNWMFTSPVIADNGKIYLKTNDNSMAEIGNKNINSRVGTLNNLTNYNTWGTNNQYRFLISVSDAGYSDMSKVEDVAVDLNSQGVNIIVVGKSQTIQDQSKELLNLIEGTYITGNTDMAIPMTDIVNYITANINGKTNGMSNVVLVNEEVKYITHYTDLEEDLKIDEYWYFKHDYSKIGSYTLSNGQGRNTTVDNKTVETPFNAFNKPGNYPTKYYVKDKIPNRIYATHTQAGDKWSNSPPRNIIVHRRPIAKFTTNKETYNIGEEIFYNNSSYDPDLEFTDPTGHKGISKTYWRYKNINDTTWHYSNYAPTSLNKPGKWYIGLQVEDVHGALSEWYTVAVDVQNNKPIAKFIAVPKVAGVNQKINLLDYSYDPDSNEIVAWEWDIEDLGTYTTACPEISFSTIGNKTITLRVQDEFGAWSDSFTETIEIIPGINHPPVAQFNPIPNPVEINKSFSLNDTSYDPDGHAIVSRIWYVKEPGLGYEKIYNNVLPPSSYSTPGEYEISLEVEDETGLWSERVTKVLTVQDPLIIDGGSNKNVYHAGEAMILHADTEGGAFKVEAVMWWPGWNDFTDTNITELVPSTAIGSPPPDINHWETRHDVIGDDYDIVVIIPKDMPDGEYQVEFRAYRKRSDGTIETVTDVINVRVEGHQYNRLKTRIIS